MFKRLLRFLAPYRPNLAFIRAREEAYERAFGVAGQILHSTDDKAPHVDLYVFPPAGLRDFVAVATGGMSDLPMAIPDGSAAAAHTELLMGIGQLEYWAANLLKLVAEYPFDQGTFYDIHHTVPFGGELGDDRSSGLIGNLCGAMTNPDGETTPTGVAEICRIAWPSHTSANFGASHRVSSDAPSVM
jgi:hypothetical protein